MKLLIVLVVSVMGVSILYPRVEMMRINHHTQTLQTDYSALSKRINHLIGLNSVCRGEL